MLIYSLSCSCSSNLTNYKTAEDMYNYRNFHN